MYETRVASRYAKSLLQLAAEKNVLDFVIYDMNMFAGICKENPAFVRTLKNPIINHDKKLSILRRLFDGNVNPLTLSLFEIITRKNREAYLPDIATEFIRQYRAMKNIVQAEVTTAVPLNDELRTLFKNVISESTQGKTVEIIEKVNPDIIGGFIIKIDDKQLDQSIQTKLKQIKNKLNEHSYISKY